MNAQRAAVLLVSSNFNHSDDDDRCLHQMKPIMRVQRQQMIFGMRRVNACARPVW
jgi:hypothetical protein